MSHLCMAVMMHLLTKFGANSSIQLGVTDIFRNSRWRVPPSWIFRLSKFDLTGVLTVWCLSSVLNLVQISVIVMHWDRRTYASYTHTHNFIHRIEIGSYIKEIIRSFDDVTRINFRFSLLVTWSSPRGRDASSHKICCRYLYPIRSYSFTFSWNSRWRPHLGFS